MSDQETPEPELEPALQQRFAALERVEPPDTWPGRAAGRGGRAPRSWFAAAAAVALIAAGVGWAVARDDGGEVTAGDQPEDAGDAGQAGEEPVAAGECPVTTPPASAFTPPEPWPATPPAGDVVWYGTDDLWTVLSIDGHTPRKSVWWSAAFPGGGVEPEPEIAVVYERLDDPGDDEAVVDLGPKGTNANTAEDGWFMIAGGEPETPGCWQATATYKDATLTYVFEVPAGTTPSSIPPVGDGGVDGPLMFSAPWDPATGVEYADLSGTIELDDGCLFLRNGDASPILWPFGSRWQAEPPGVFTPTGDFVPVGGRVAGAGGYHGPDDLEYYVQDEAALTMAERCAQVESGQVAVIQGGGIEVVAASPSQNQADAARDGVLEAVAARPNEDRVGVLAEADASEGTWVLSRIPSDRVDGSWDGLAEYAEILLLDGEGEIIRAYPMPGAVPSWLLVTDEAVLAGRIGDGGMPDSTLVRIDRATLEARVVLIPAPFDGGSTWPDAWRVATPEQAAAYAAVVGFATDGATGAATESWIGEVVVDVARAEALIDDVFG